MSIAHVGFVGVGRMGEPMAGHILKHGFPVTVYDVAPRPLERLAQRGAQVAASLEAALQVGDVVITMLPSDEVLQGMADTLVDNLRPSSILVDMSTSRLTTSRAIGVRLADKGVAMLDAPVTGGVGGAQKGTLSIMVGGDALTLARCAPVLEAMASQVTHIGPAGHGLMAKYVNQMIMESTMAAIGEAFSFAAQAGVDTAKVYDAIRGGAAQSFVLDTSAAIVGRGDFGAGRELALHAKDGGYVLAAAEVVGAWTPMTAASHEILKLAVVQGESDHGWAALVRVYERLWKNKD
ncbi:MAG: NAD(P)-dependent oxidoreductase [Anaerolineae bacterium]|nr:NAD(P)-dependent oxidoreductase [Anaerolineae bacterium]